MLLRYLDELLHWNRSINLTAVNDPQEALEKHLVDSLTPLPLLTGREKLLDLGSGGGLPGIPLKIVSKGLRVVSVEAVGKKAAFQRHVVRLLELADFEVRQQRAEDPRLRDALAHSFDIIISRAFTSLSGFAGLAVPFLAPGGKIVAMKGPEGERELDSAQNDLAQMSLECLEVRRLTLPVSGARRLLIVLGEVMRR